MATRKKKRRKRTAAQSNLMVLKLLILVVVVLVVFEGRMIYTMFTTSSSDKTMAAVNAQTAGKTKEKTEEDALLSAAAENEDTDTASDSSTGSALGMAGLAGLASAENVSGNTSAVTAESSSDDGRISEELDSAAVVPEQDPPVDDYYFNDAVFIGDSRMEGFRNTSGITQGEFLTSVGMTLTSIGDTKVNTSDGQITVYQGLSGRQYGKIYLMLGANDLGFYPWEQFKDRAEGVLTQMHELQPGAIIYVCGVIYVEGAKISTSYVNNDNVRKVNGYLLEACEDLSFCHYLNLNEVFTNGYGSLIEGATADGVHLQPNYSKLMLDYLKSHYIVYDAPEEQTTEASDDV